MPPVSMRTAASLIAAAIALLAHAAFAQTTLPAPPASPPPSVDALDAASPLAPLPDLGVAWPDLAAPEAGVPGGRPAAGAVPAGEQLSRYRVALEGAEPLGTAFRTRFDELSVLVAGEGKPANIAQIDRRAKEDETLLRALLRAAGHYDGEVSSAVANEEGSVIARLTLAPGPAYSFTSVALPGLDAAGPGAGALAAKFTVKPGDPVDADRVNTAIAAFTAQLGRDGYPFARVAEPDIVVDHASLQATLALPVTLGERARFGRIRATGTRPVFSAPHLGDIARFQPGEPYDSARIEDFRRALIQTSLVSVATVTPVPSGTPGVVDIEVRTERAPPRTIAGSFGYGTGEGARAEVSWQHRNLLPPEGAVTFRGVAGTREQLASATLRKGNFRARDRVLNAQVLAAHSNLNAYDARTFGVSASVERQTNIIWQKTWSWSVGAELLATDEKENAVSGIDRRRTFIVAALPSSLNYDTSDDLLNPTRGIRLAGRVSPEASLHKQVDGYLKVQLDASGYLPLGRFVLAGRVRGATIQGAAREDIAPSRRLYAGGGGSVRGYGYQKIGPADVNGDPIGGRGLVEFGAEARIRFGAFGVVPFLDGGSLVAASTPSFKSMRYGAGLGARYYSSFGPIRIDVGTPLNRRRGDSRIAVYVSLGQAF